MIRLRLIILIIALTLPSLNAKYEPNWNSLDSRPLPSWFDESKLGIFLHWGVYSVPGYSGYGAEWFWYQWRNKEKMAIDLIEKYYGKSFTYSDFAKEFTAEFFNATDWAEMFANSGAKYVILTAKHHDGFALWPTKYSFGWSARDIGPGRDLVGELADAVRKKGLKFGVYHSLFEWYNPLWLADSAAGFKTRNFVDNKVLPQLRELVETYKPHLIFSDGEKAVDTYWRSPEFLAWLYNDSPVKDFVVVNDRWGWGTSCKHGGYFTCADRFNPGTLQKHKFENAMSIDRASWGYRRQAKLNDYYTFHQLISEIVQTISCGGNMLMNIGPTKEGNIAPIFQQRLKSMGDWLEINGEAIYGTKPWTVQNDTHTSGVWYTSKKTDLYAIVLFWPADNVLTLESPVALLKDANAKVILLGSTREPLKHAITDGKVRITFPDKSKVTSNEAYVLKISK